MTSDDDTPTNEEDELVEDWHFRITREDWHSHITDTTQFTDEEIREAVHTLSANGFGIAMSAAIVSIAEFAHEWNLPLDQTAETVANVYWLSDASLAEVFDSLERLQE